jgi:hypothetical protein
MGLAAKMLSATRRCCSPTGEDVVSCRRMLLPTARKRLGGDDVVGNPKK